MKSLAVPGLKILLHISGLQTFLVIFHINFVGLHIQCSDQMNMGTMSKALFFFTSSKENNQSIGIEGNKRSHLF